MHKYNTQRVLNLIIKNVCIYNENLMSIDLEALVNNEILPTL